MTDQILSTPAASCSLRSIRIRHGNLNIRADLTAGPFKYVKTILSYQNKLDKDATSFDFRTDYIADRKSTVRLQISLNLKDLLLKSLYWHVYIILEDPASGSLQRFLSIWIPGNGFFINSFITERIIPKTAFLSIRFIPETKRSHSPTVSVPHTMALFLFIRDVCSPALPSHSQLLEKTAYLPCM